MSAAPMISTYSMWSLFRNCRKAVDWRYLQNLVPLERDGNLNYGSLIHDCLETWHRYRNLDQVLGLIDLRCPDRTHDERQRRDWHLATAMMTGYGNNNSPRPGRDHLLHWPKIYRRWSAHRVRRVRPVCRSRLCQTQ